MYNVCTNIYIYIQACVVHGQAAVFLQGAGRQIGVLVFDLAIEGKPPFIFVVGEKRFQREHFAQRETWPHRAPLPDKHHRQKSEGKRATGGLIYIRNFRYIYKDEEVDRRNITKINAKLNFCD